MAEAGVGLAEAIGAVREELIAAQLAGRGKDVTFSVGKVVIELAGEIKTTGGVGGGVKFWVVSVDAKGERSSSATHKVSVELTPQGSDGSSLRVHGDVAAPPAG